MLFGNWIVTENSISWKGSTQQRFEIPVTELTVKRRYNADVVFYEAILLATSQEWLTQNDLYDLNYAFIYAVAKFNLEFDYEIFDATLAQQYEQFEEEEDDEDE
ncbi:MAG: hypothetical protein JWQ96_2858 [Segetibacter sp.]|nr:hypothetical protein [Segetibacter sp.]